MMFKILQLQTNLRHITFAKTLFKAPSDLTTYTPCGQQLWTWTTIEVRYGPGCRSHVELNAKCSK